MTRFKETWEFFGDKEPYFAVLSAERFKTKNIGDDTTAEFFESGEDHIRRLWNEIGTNFEPSFRPKNALDFGCGVGRLLIPIAKRAVRVTGVDISEQMLAHTERNCKRTGVENFRLQQVDDMLAEKSETFDFIHSFIVFQHIHPDDGIQIFRHLLDRLEVGGIGALHVTFGPGENRFRMLRAGLYRDLPWLNKLKNLVTRAEQAPAIPVYSYDLNQIFAILKENDCHDMLVRFTSHGVDGAFLIFRKQRAQLY
jgi:SAM-dependent methyltransferase